MIVIKFSVRYEDRVNLYLKSSILKKHGITWDFKENPTVVDFQNQCYWLIDYKHSKLVNTVLSELKEMKQIMGVHDLQFQYCHSQKEFYTQTNSSSMRSINWFEV
jgi:hypothetical protein